MLKRLVTLHPFAFLLLMNSITTYRNLPQLSAICDKPQPNILGTCALKSVVPAQPERTMQATDWNLVPEPFRVVASAVLYAACSLALDYTDTVLTECVRLKLPYKKQCRVVRTLRDNYLKFRQYTVNGRAEEAETELGLSIEDACIQKLQYVNVMSRNVAVRHKIYDEERNFVSSVVQALCVTTAIMGYSSLIDNKVGQLFRIAKPSDHMMLPKEIEQIHFYLSAFVTKEVWEDLKDFVKTGAKDILMALVGGEVSGCEFMRRMRFRKWTKAEERFAMLDLGDAVTDEQKALIIGRSERAMKNKIKELTNTKGK